MSVNRVGYTAFSYGNTLTAYENIFFDGSVDPAGFSVTGELGTVTRQQTIGAKTFYLIDGRYWVTDGGRGYLTFSDRNYIGGGEESNTKEGLLSIPFSLPYWWLIALLLIAILLYLPKVAKKRLKALF